MEEYLEDLGEEDFLDMVGGGGADGFCDDLLWWLVRPDGLGDPSLPDLSILGEDLCCWTGDLDTGLSSLGGGDPCCEGCAGDLRCLGRGGKILGGDLWSLGTLGTSSGDLSWLNGGGGPGSPMYGGSCSYLGGEFLCGE